MAVHGGAMLDAVTSAAELRLPVLADAPLRLAPALVLPPAAAGLAAVQEVSVLGGPGRAAASTTAQGATPTPVLPSQGVRDDVLVPGDELVLTVAVCEPGPRGRGAVMAELQLLGSNTLAELRDALVCPLDALAAALGAGGGGAYFSLGGAWYDDTRAAPQSECSGPLARWAAVVGLAEPAGLLGAEFAGGPAAAAGAAVEMTATQVADLSLSVSNRPVGVYGHHGVCEHALIVRDVRLLSAGDALLRSAYPRVVRTASNRRYLKCSVCRRRGGRVLLVGHPEAPEHVALLCSSCDGLFGQCDRPGITRVVLHGEGAGERLGPAAALEQEQRQQQQQHEQGQAQRQEQPPQQQQQQQGR